MPIESNKENRSYTNQCEDAKEFMPASGKGLATKCSGCGAPVPGSCSCTGACKGCRSCKEYSVEEKKI